jgi:hypothetical protein
MLRRALVFVATSVACGIGSTTHAQRSQATDPNQSSAPPLGSPLATLQNRMNAVRPRPAVDVTVTQGECRPGNRPGASQSCRFSANAVDMLVATTADNRTIREMLLSIEAPYLPIAEAQLQSTAFLVARVFEPHVSADETGRLMASLLDNPTRPGSGGLVIGTTYFTRRMIPFAGRHVISVIVRRESRPRSSV